MSPRRFLLGDFFREISSRRLVLGDFFGETSSGYIIRKPVANSLRATD